jgi:hypothetical protein
MHVIEQAAYLLAARKQREGEEEAGVSISPSNAFPQHPHFLLLDPTS